MEALLRKVEEHFRKKEWEELERASDELIRSCTKPEVEALARGFKSYARAKQEHDVERVISLLTEAARAFKGVDELLHSMATTERLLLLSVFDESNRGRHLKALGEFSLNRFLRTRSEGDIRLAIEALERAREHLDGGELAEVELNLTFCYGSLAEVSSSPEREYERVLALCRELEERYKENREMLARLKMNHATTLQNLANLRPEEALKLLEEAASLNREAVQIFRELGAEVLLVRAMQSLANIYREAAKFSDAYLERFIQVKRETSGLFSKAGYRTSAALEELEAALARVELAAKRGDREELDSALEAISGVSEVFREEGRTEELAHSLAALGAALRSRAKLSSNAGEEHLRRAVESYEEAIRLFADESYVAAAKVGLAQVYRDLAKLTGKEEYKRKAEAVEKEVKKLAEK